MITIYGLYFTISTMFIYQLPTITSSLCLAASTQYWNDLLVSNTNKGLCLYNHPSFDHFFDLDTFWIRCRTFGHFFDLLADSNLVNLIRCPAYLNVCVISYVGKNAAFSQNVLVVYMFISDSLSLAYSAWEEWHLFSRRMLYSSSLVQMFYYCLAKHFC